MTIHRLLFQVFIMIISAFSFSACLKTRSDLGDGYQSQVYGRKQADNQKAKSLEPIESAKVDEKDELIRNLNGRVDGLEYQLSQVQAELQKSKQDTTQAQKIQLLQDSITKMDAQIAKLETDLSHKASDAHEVVKETAPAKDAVAGKSTKSSFDIAQEYFAKKDFKNAILEYKKFEDANTKSKSKSKLLPEAKYKMGLCFESLGLKDEAQSFYEEVAAQYGATDFGKKAKLKIKKKK